MVGEGLRPCRIKGTAARKGQMSREDLEQLLRKNRTPDHLVVLDGIFRRGPYYSVAVLFLQTGEALDTSFFRKDPWKKLRRNSLPCPYSVL